VYQLPSSDWIASGTICYSCRFPVLHLGVMLDKGGTKPAQAECTASPSGILPLSWLSQVVTPPPAGVGITKPTDTIRLGG
jgi:hypothetical protein